jgi:hypothetical protein
MPDAKPSKADAAPRGGVFSRPGFFWKTLRYGLAAVGPIGVAGSQFVLSVQLLHLLSVNDFGIFSFLLVASQFSTGVWSALLCAPMPILLASGDGAAQVAMRRSLMSANLIFCLLAFGAFAGLALALKAPLNIALMFGGYGAALLMRWFARAYAYAIGKPWRTMISDIIYSLVLLALVGFMLMAHTKSLLLPYAGLLVSALLGLAPFGLTFIRQQFLEVSARALAGYADIWRAHSGWSLVGVLTTEATANAHAYIVTLISGATAFAPWPPAPC